MANQLFLTFPNWSHGRVVRQLAGHFNISLRDRPNRAIIESVVRGAVGFEHGYVQFLQNAVQMYGSNPVCAIAAALQDFDRHLGWLD